MSYIYGASILDVSRSHTTTHRIPPGAWIFVCCECRVLSGRGLCDELIARPEESYRLCYVVVCDLETSRVGAPYIYDISRLRVKQIVTMFEQVHTGSGRRRIDWTKCRQCPNRSVMPALGGGFDSNCGIQKIFPSCPDGDHDHLQPNRNNYEDISSRVYSCTLQMEVPPNSRNPLRNHTASRPKRHYSSKIPP